MDGIKLTIGEDGIARMYDDEFDVVIHCESEAEQEQLIRELNRMKWTPTKEGLPEDDSMKLVSCRTKKGANNVNRAYYMNGAWHGSGSMSGVVAWMELPEPYKE